MTELDYLDRQQNLALDRVRHALLGRLHADRDRLLGRGTRV